jgi:YesN/AraC family two-component response regulator
MQSLKVLIVDDSLLTVKTLTSMLIDMGHYVTQTAATGAQALSAYRDSSPDLVTMDITMPDMDGIQATSSIIAEFPKANIIMVTSHGQEAMVMKAIKAGAKGYVLKPIKPDKLRDMVDRIFT